MCLIAYVKAGQSIPEENFRSAAHDNDDGIGIMHRDGIEKFLGRKMVKRAWRLTRRLQDAGQEFAVHFRFATHGRVALSNTHPFKTPDGNAYVMHNGILSAYTPTDKNGDMSDTRALVEVMQGVDVGGDESYWRLLADHIGHGNKLCVMSRDGDFRLVNEDMGDWIGGVWYSQTYSLPGYGFADQYGGAYGRSTTYGGGPWMRRGSNGAYVIDKYGRYTEIGYENGNSNGYATPRLSYEVKTALQALDRREAASGAGTHELPADTYTRGSDTEEGAALDAELERHFADMDDGDGEPTDICPSCETLHSNGRECPECGFIDTTDGLTYQVARTARA